MLVMVGLPARGKSLIAGKGMKTCDCCELEASLWLTSTHLSRSIPELALYKRENIQRRTISTEEHPSSDIGVLPERQRRGPEGPPGRC